MPGQPHNTQLATRLPVVHATARRLAEEARQLHTTHADATASEAVRVALEAYELAKPGDGVMMNAGDERLLASVVALDANVVDWACTPPTHRLLGSTRHAWISGEWQRDNEGTPEHVPPVAVVGVLRVPRADETGEVARAAAAVSCFHEDILMVELVGATRVAAVVAAADAGGPTVDKAARMLDRLIFSACWHLDGSKRVLQLFDITALEPDAPTAVPLLPPPLESSKKLKTLTGAFAAVGPVVRHLGVPFFVLEVYTSDTPTNSVAVCCIGSPPSRTWFLASRAVPGDLVSLTNLRRGALHVEGAVTSQGMRCYYTTDATTVSFQVQACAANAPANTHPTKAATNAAEVNFAGVLTGWRAAGTLLAVLNGGERELNVASWPGSFLPSSLAALRAGTWIAVHRALVLGDIALAATPRTRIAIVHPAAPTHVHGIPRGLRVVAGSDASVERLVQVLCGSRARRYEWGVRTLLADVVGGEGADSFWLRDARRVEDADLRESAFARLVRAIAWHDPNERPSRPWYDEALAHAMPAAAARDAALLAETSTRGVECFVPRAVEIDTLVGACLGGGKAIVPEAAIFCERAPVTFYEDRHHLYQPSGDDAGDVHGAGRSAMMLVVNLIVHPRTGRWVLQDASGSTISVVFSESAARYVRHIVEAAGLRDVWLCITRYVIRATVLPQSSLRIASVGVDAPDALVPFFDGCAAHQTMNPHPPCGGSDPEEFWLVVPTHVTSFKSVNVLVLPIGIFSREPMATSHEFPAVPGLLRVPMVENGNLSEIQQHKFAVYVQLRQGASWPGFPQAPDSPHLSNLLLKVNVRSHLAVLEAGVGRVFLVPAPSAGDTLAPGGHVPLEVSLSDGGYGSRGAAEAMHASLSIGSRQAVGQAICSAVYHHDDIAGKSIREVMAHLSPKDTRKVHGVVDHAEVTVASMSGEGMMQNSPSLQIRLTLRDCREGFDDSLQVITAAHVPLDAFPPCAFCPGTIVSLSHVRVKARGKRRTLFAEFDPSCCATVLPCVPPSTASVERHSKPPPRGFLDGASERSASSSMCPTPCRATVAACSRLEIGLMCRTCLAMNRGVPPVAGLCAHNRTELQLSLIAFMHIVDGSGDADAFAEGAEAWKLLHGPNARPPPSYVELGESQEHSPVLALVLRRRNERFVAQAKRTEHDDNVEVRDGANNLVQGDDRVVLAAFLRDAQAHGPAILLVQPNDEEGRARSTSQVRVKAVRWVDRADSRSELLMSGV